MTFMTGWVCPARLARAAGRMAFLFLISAAGCLPVASAQLVTTGVYVGNQGNFSDANGTVTYYEPASGNVIVDAVPNLNTLVQHITLHGDTGYIVANTSDRIDMFDLNTRERTGQITAVAGPRFLAVADDGTAYVTNLFSNTVTILDLVNSTTAGTIPTGSNPEDIVFLGTHAFVANHGFGFDSTLTRIDTETNLVTTTIDLGCDGPRVLELDGQQDIWAVCTGKTVYNSDFTEIIEQTSGQVVVLNEAGTVLERFERDAQLGTAAAGQDSFHDPVTDQLFVVQDPSILRFDTTTNTFLDTIELSGTDPIGGIAYDASNDLLYVARVPDYTSAGYVSLHTLDGMETDRFTTGIAPTTIALVQTGTSVALDDALPLPQRLRVGTNYPNPFHARTTITFEISQPSRITATVFDALGAEMATLAGTTYPAGRHEIHWDATGHPAGVYFYTVTATGATSTVESRSKMMIRIK